MKALVQRCRGDVLIEIEKEDGEREKQGFSGVGLIVFLGWMHSDLTSPSMDESEEWIFSRIMGLRIFDDIDGKMNLSLADYAQQNKMPSGILWVSQFTLAAELESGFRPSFIKALSPVLAKKRFDSFCHKIKDFKSPHTHIFGSFGGMMHINFTNWGPVTIMLEK